DHLSRGRMLLGIGVGWLEEEFDAIGVPFAERGKRTDEYVAAMRALWSQEKATYHGDFVHFDDCIMRPRPVGSMPVHVGGHTDIAARRAGRLGDGYFPGKGTHEELARTFDIVRTTAREYGRDPDAIEMTTAGNGVVGSGALDELKALVDLGVARVIVPAFLFYRDTEASLARYGEEVISRA
ncbi:MAG: LLM class flavin-dependent oxidoreductase, partial [Acidobacteria bacterium]|nr:LLM class flavin-dependent oxidoreductase [Acidobacteriota bacterium]